MGEVITVTLPLVPSKNTNLTEVTYRKQYVIGVAKVSDKLDQCVVYAQDMPPMAVALSADAVKDIVFGENMPCAKAE